MRHEKYPLAAAAFLIITSTLAAQASPLTLQEQAQAFATCAGRYSALATRQSATHDPDSALSRRMQNDFEMLLEATLPHAVAIGIDPSQARQWRSTGWTEMARLMRLQYYGTDADRAARAHADMQRRLSICRRMILPA